VGTAGCLGWGIRFDRDVGDSLDLDDPGELGAALDGSALGSWVVQTLNCTLLAAVAAEEDTAGVLLDWHSAVGHRTDCWQQCSLLCVVVGSRQIGNSSIHPSLALVAHLMTETNPDC